MSQPYHEIFEGEVLARVAPGVRHESICSRLHGAVRNSVGALSHMRLLAPRTQVRVSSGTFLSPDLALIAAATGKLWLAAEIVNSEDHRADTVVKKQVYEEFKLPRLWMVDPRYDNVEIYHASEYGLVLKGILAGRETITEKLLPGFQMTVAELFENEKPQS